MKIIVRQLGCVDYARSFEKMKQHTAGATKEEADELWLCEHSPVYTQGRHQTLIPVINPHHIPTIASDRGGKITYHGPGQLIAYCLTDLKRLGQGPKLFVHHIEQILIDLLHQYDILAERREGAPGIYVGPAKIASLGFRIKNGHTYHGLSLNVSMDLTPFQWIHPCGYADLKMVNMIDYCPSVTIQSVQEQLIKLYALSFGYYTQLDI